MIRRLLPALPAFVLASTLAGTAGATWKIMFLPDEATGVAITIDGEHVFDWKSVEGQSVKDVPAKWATLEKIHVRAEGSPKGRRAHVKVFWNDDEECEMKFDDGEECTAAR